jgi:hypothetical protein
MINEQCCNHSVSHSKPFQKTFLLLSEDIFFTKLTSVLYEVAETACWDLEDVLKIFALKKASNDSISILFLLVISFMVITKYYSTYLFLEWNTRPTFCGFLKTLHIISTRYL